MRFRPFRDVRFRSARQPAAGSLPRDRLLPTLRRIAIGLARVVTGLALAAALLPAAAQAQTGGEATVRRIIEERMPGVQVTGVTRTGYAGLYEVYTDDNEIFYTDDKVSFIFVGTVHDGRNPQRNLTEERLQSLTAVKYGDLPFENAFKIVRGNGRRQVAYFTDPNCPYCKQLERELMQVSDITINVFLYPILTADSAPKARAIWCSPDRSKSWLDWMLNGVAPTTPPSGCDSQNLERMLAFGRKLRVTSVPTLMFPNGARFSGARPVAQLVKALDESNPPAGR